MNEETGGLNLKKNVSRRSIWMRLVFMIVMAIAYGVAEAVAFAVVAFQFLSSLFTGQPNARLADFGRNLARYFQEITLFMTFATEEKPFPFGPWPDERHAETPAENAPAASEHEPEQAGDAHGKEEAAEPKKRPARRSAAKPKPRTSRKTGS